ncbi:MAG: BNR-4 repeat-containing protein [Pirellulales bacterium]|nr:BNR-4 repeat-containing protein [Pirellulales bacterium]
MMSIRRFDMRLFVSRGYRPLVRSRYILFLIVALVMWSNAIPVASAQQDLVNGNLIMMNHNGGWCWYQDERILFDETTERVLCASVGEAGGLGGSIANGDLDITSFDLSTGDRTSFLLKNNYNANDHAVPALWQRPDGRYIAAYSNHNGSGSTLFRISDNSHDINEWGPEFSFDWSAASGESASSTYNNLLYMSAEGTGVGRLYNITRHFERSPIVSYSDDWGETWHYAGPLTLPDVSRGYSNGYIKFVSNGVDRIDFIVTEGHPRHFNNNIYHGYIQGGQTCNSTGDVIDANLFDDSAPAPEVFTPVFVSSPEDGENDDSEYHRAWTTELQRDAKGNIYGLFTTRYGTETAPSFPDEFYPDGYRQLGDGDHRLFYARLDIATSQWQYTEVAKMGEPLYSREQDYTGLGAIDPKDPSTIYISTAIDPRTDTNTTHREIYKGRTLNQGETWQWTAITENSLVDNLRPIIPSGNGTSTAVLWLRGSFPHFSDYHQTVVGIIDRPNERLEATHYVDADRVNTTFADGSTLITTGPDSGQGPADDLWHERIGYANNGTIFASNEKGAEDTPVLKTTLTGIADGTYDVFAFFWTNVSEEWLIEVGFSEDAMVLCERQGAQQALADEFDDTVLTAEGTNRALYRAYVGRTDIAGGSLSVFIDDLEDATTDGHQRVWYDGLGYARVLTAGPGDADFSGTVDAADARILAENWLSTDHVGWAQGDFNGDGVVDDLDASILAAHWNPAPESSVPEPTLLTLALSALLALLFRHRLW